MTYKEMVNEILANPTVSQEVKKELQCVASSYLRAHGEYKGFNNIHWIKEGANKYFKMVEEGLIQKDWKTQNLFTGPEYDIFFY